MNEIKASDARNKLGALLNRVEQGEEIIVTRYGRAIARLVPNVREVDHPQAQVALQRMRNRAEQARFGAFDWEALKADREASRP